MQQPIPVTIITGFLGAGKTTLLNQLIEQHPDTKFAIIENEFGDIGIDNELVVNADEGIFELSNGCICCTLNNELVETLANLIRSEKSFDHLIIETTGIAEPDAIAAAFVADPAVQRYFQLDGTICMVDAGHVEEVLADREEAHKQITFADMIVLNKQSTADPDQVAQVREKIKVMNPFAAMVATDFGKVKEDLLHLQAYANTTVEEKLNAMPHVHHHHHTHDIQSHSFVFDQPFDFLKFMHWSKVLLLVQGKNIYRIKGILHFQHEKERMIFQSVKTSSAFQRGAAWAAGTPPQSKLVFIGKGLKREAFERSLRSCLA
jgi:G3E family GTPase